MNDLISRQAAIDAFTHKWDGMVTSVFDVVNSLPSAQTDLDEWCTDCKEYDKERNSCPRWNRVIKETLKDLQEERKMQLSEENTTSDCISRQKAIRWVKTECNPYGKPTLDYESGKKVIEHLEAMPSAQPERKKPVFKTGESVYHVSYADGTGGFEKNKWADWTCPDCGWFVGEQYIPRRHNQRKCNYCAKCGCAIDWSDADMRGEQDIPEEE